MTQDEIIEIARDSGMELYGLGKDRARFVHHLVAFANLVAAKEREACAKLCDESVDYWVKGGYLESAEIMEASQLAINIRARGQA